MASSNEVCIPQSEQSIESGRFHVMGSSLTSSPLIMLHSNDGDSRVYAHHFIFLKLLLLLIREAWAHPQMMDQKVIFVKNLHLF